MFFTFQVFHDNVDQGSICILQDKHLSLQFLKLLQFLPIDHNSHVLGRKVLS